MAEVAPAPAPTTAPAKVAKKKRVAKPKTGPGLRELIVAAVTASKERGGMSLSALKKNLAAGGYDVEKNKSRVKAAVRALVDNGTLVHTKGTGASGSFKLGAKKAAPKAKKPAKKAAVKAKKPATKAVKAKKPAAAPKTKTTAAKKSPKKAKKAAVKKTAKSPAKPAKSPKKAKAPNTRCKLTWQFFRIIQN
uniref:Histone H1 n=1 Tax=Sparus aurata TaxID=8175 RepID=A0A671VCQ7_SPAAU